jgi:hypothetical protein
MAPPSLSGNGGPTSKEDCEHIVSQLMDPNFRMSPYLFTCTIADEVANKRRLELGM